MAWILKIIENLMEVIPKPARKDKTYMSFIR